MINTATAGRFRVVAAAAAKAEAEHSDGVVLTTQIMGVVAKEALLMALTGAAGKVVSGGTAAGHSAATVQWARAAHLPMIFDKTLSAQDNAGKALKDASDGNWVNAFVHTVGAGLDMWMVKGAWDGAAKVLTPIERFMAEQAAKAAQAAKIAKAAQAAQVAKIDGYSVESLGGGVRGLKGPDGKSLPDSPTFKTINQAQAAANYLNAKALPLSGKPSLLPFASKGNQLPPAALVEIEKITKLYPPTAGDCLRCAEKIRDVLRGLGRDVEIIAFRQQGKITKQYLPGAAQEFAEGWHVVVYDKSTGRIIDAITGPAGVPAEIYREWWRVNIGGEWKEMGLAQLMKILGYD